MNTVSLLIPTGHIPPVTLWSIICPENINETTQPLPMQYPDLLHVKVLLHLEADGKSYREVNLASGGLIGVAAYHPPASPDGTSPNIPPNSVVEVWGPVSAFRAQDYTQLQHQIVYLSNTSSSQSSSTPTTTTINAMLYQHFIFAQQYITTHHPNTLTRPDPPALPIPPTKPEHVAPALPFKWAKWCPTCSQYVRDPIGPNQKRCSSTSCGGYTPIKPGLSCPATYHGVRCLYCGTWGRADKQGNECTTNWRNGLCSKCCLHPQYKQPLDGQCLFCARPASGSNVKNLCKTCCVDQLTFCPNCLTKQPLLTNTEHLAQTLALHRVAMRLYDTEFENYQHLVASRQSDYEQELALFEATQRRFQHFQLSAFEFDVPIKHGSGDGSSNDDDDDGDHKDIDLNKESNGTTPFTNHLMLMFGVVVEVQRHSVVIATAKHSALSQAPLTTITSSHLQCQHITIPLEQQHIGRVSSLPQVGGMYLVVSMVKYDGNSNSGDDHHNNIIGANKNKNNNDKNNKNNNKNPANYQYVYINHQEILPPYLLTQTSATRYGDHVTMLTTIFDNPLRSQHTMTLLTTLFAHHHMQVLTKAKIIPPEDYLSQIQDAKKKTLFDHFYVDYISHPKAIVLNSITLLKRYQDQQYLNDHHDDHGSIKYDEIKEKCQNFPIAESLSQLLPPNMLEEIITALDVYDKQLHAIVETSPAVVLAMAENGGEVQSEEYCEYQQLLLEYQMYCSEVTTALTTLMANLPYNFTTHEKIYPHISHLLTKKNVETNDERNTTNNNTTNEQQQSHTHNNDGGDFPDNHHISPSHSIITTIPPANLSTLVATHHVSDVQTKEYQYLVNVFKQQRLTKRRLAAIENHNIVQHLVLQPQLLSNAPSPISQHHTTQHPTSSLIGLRANLTTLLEHAASSSDPHTNQQHQQQQQQTQILYDQQQRIELLHKSKHDFLLQQIETKDKQLDSQAQHHQQELAAKEKFYQKQLTAKDEFYQQQLAEKERQLQLLLEKLK